MNVQQLLSQTGILDILSQQMNIPKEQTQNILNNILPVMSQSLQEQTKTPENIPKLQNALHKGQHDRFIDHPDKLLKSKNIEDGNKILEHLFGSKEGSREVASQVANRTHTEPNLIKQALPMVASIAMGMLSKQSNTLGFGSQKALTENELSPLLKMLDADNDGQILDDALGLVQKLFLGNKH